MSKWIDVINKFNPEEDDLSDLLDEAEKIGRADAIDEFAEHIIAIIDDIGYVNIISINQIREQLKEQTE